MLETHSRSLEEKPYYREEGIFQESFEPDWSGWEVGSHHRRLPQTPRRPSTLLNYQPSLLNQQNIQQHNLQTQVSQAGQASVPPPAEHAEEQPEHQQYL